MVEAVSNGPIEGEVLIPTVVDEPKVEETSKTEVSEGITSKDQLKSFLEKGGEQVKYRSVLISLYGEKLVDRTFPKGWKEELSRDNCLEILERVGQGVTIEDLEGFYAELKSGEIKSKILKNALLPYVRMWWAGSVRDLPPYWFAHFVDLFQNPLKEMKLDVEVDKISYVDRGESLSIHYSKQVHKLMKLGDQSRPEFFYAPRELLAKTIAYTRPAAMVDGAMIPIFDEKLGRLVYYTLKGQLHDNGLHAYLFVPLEQGNFPAKLIFRGTNGYASVGRDLDASGVGKRTFIANKEKIGDLVKQAKVDQVEVIGHSLGAGDAQRALALLVEPEKEFSFKEISLYAFCAPRLEIERVNQWKEDLKALAEKNKHPVIRLNYAHHESDVVTWTGDSYLSGAELDFIYSNYMMVRSNSGAMKTPAHHTTSFFKDGNFDFETDGRTFELKHSFPNQDLERELRKLEQIQNSWQLWRGVKSYFVKVETKEEVEARIEEMKKHQAEISMMEKGGSQHSWLVYSGWSAVRYTVQPVVYYTFEGFRALANWRR